MPCKTHVLGKLKIPMAVYILPAKGNDSIICHPGFPVDATIWRLSQAGIKYFITVRFLSHGNGISASGVCNFRTS